MVKFFECPDLHYSGANSEIVTTLLERIDRTAQDRAVDFILLPGDLHDSPIYVGDKSGHNKLRQAIERVRVPMYAIEGTPSHDAPGSYEALADVGLTLVNPMVPVRLPNALLFGVPELTKKNVQAQLNLPAEAAAGATLDLFYRHVDEFIAPRVRGNRSVPSICMLHGTVSDARQENSTDRIVRHSSMVIHTEALSDAGITRWSLGHIHTPWESERISAGYAGSWGGSWNEQGFLPGYNMVTIDDDHNVIIERLPYGTPERRHIYTLPAACNPDVAYWLETDDPGAQLPRDVHPWSRITIKPQDRQTRRLESGTDERMTLAQMAAEIDPEIPDGAAALFDQLEADMPAEAIATRDIAVESVEVAGCRLFRGRTVSLDIAALDSGLTEITGASNGSGKSSLLAFCTPYPGVVGKTTKSGRPSAIKDFFDARDSWIRKTITYNGQRHEHRIDIKGAHTKTAKVECYLTIEGAPQLDCGTWDEMHAMCEELYGAFDDYVLTSFFIQPGQSDKYPSGLTGAGKTAARNLVMTIAGIDRGPQKEAALSRQRTNEQRSHDLEVRCDALHEQLTDTDVLTEMRERATAGLTETLSALAACEADGKRAKQAIADIQSEADEQIRRRAERDKHTADARRLTDDAALIKERIDSIAKETVQIGMIQDELKRSDEINDEYERLRTAAQEEHERNIAASKAHAAALQAYNDRVFAKQNADRAVENLTGQLSLIEQRIDSVVPCPKCGYIDAEATANIAEWKSAAGRLKEQIGDAVRTREATPDPGDRPEPMTECSTAQNELKQARRIDTGDLKARLAAAQARQDQYGPMTAQYKDLLSQIDGANAAAAAIEIDDTVEQRMKAARDEHDLLVDSWRTISLQVSEYKAAIKTADERIAEHWRKTKEIAEIERDATVAREAGKLWAYVARMLNADKIPAAELELVAAEIDSRATQIIRPYHDGRYAIRTETQQAGRNGKMVDRFDIVIIDQEDGTERSFWEHSPGEKAMHNDAYVKSLLAMRRARNKTAYDPIIADEADAPLSTENVIRFYEMQDAYYADDDSRVLVVTHSQDAKGYIQHSIKIEELMN